MWVENDSNLPKSFLDMFQISSDKTASILKLNALVAYPVLAEFLNFTSQFRRYVIDTGYTLVGFLQVGNQNILTDVNITESYEMISVYGFTSFNSVLLMDNVMLTFTSDGRDSKMGSLHPSLDYFYHLNAAMQGPVSK